MRSKICVLAVSVVVSAGLATACSPTTGGVASPAPSSSAPAGTSSPVDPEVPKVTQPPLDAGKYASDPCGLVPKDLLASLRYTDPGKYTPQGDTPATAAGPSCLWKLSGEGLGLSAALGTGNREQGAGGLAGAYAAYRSGKITKFLERAPDVDGYPAIYVDVQDERALGSCGLDVGIADDLAFNVYAQGYQGQDDSCAVASQVAASIIKTLKGA
ncbi:MULTISPECIES: DUF3558 domain-containing protein [unclassified Amycolatopsis]|uniref:DUF3558 domain-containing protein n=1 Tax=unclassified Amycolatopsis TaxID=2618356 RepID=UPI002876772E|nr:MULTISPECIES: DUF3558 domain-containing protein [unclassified Amycolatopsis]MDS0137030.1 DUF3558 domain-containing protein [Amycolatopsis sp. 505]MDS0143695.1 DUF3558 domain-containing protein [Amycolatopsis sp. CM201R]